MSLNTLMLKNRVWLLPPPIEYTQTGSTFRYALANLLLIIGAKKEIKLLVLLWIVFTVGFLIW